jgi:peptidoglycan hydrolase CwlO-like protein
MSITDEINAISDRVLELEQENEERWQQILAYDNLVDLLEEDILWQEKNLGDRASDRMKAIVAAYRAVRPKEG